MKKTLLTMILTLLIAAGVFVSPLSATEGEDWYLPENPLEGQEVFFSLGCPKCHSVQGIGGTIGSDLGEINVNSFSDITSSLWNHLPRMQEAYVKHGMKWTELTEDQGRKLVQFIYFLKYFEGQPNAELGERLYLEKGCVRCHAVGGRGGDIGPELDKYQTLFAAPYITAGIWNSGPKMQAKQKENGVPTPEFMERDVVDILAFIRAKGNSEKLEHRMVRMGNPVQGKELFKNRNCTKCHSSGKTNKAAPDFADSNLRGTQSQILSQMWNHSTNMWDEMKKENVSFPKFQPEEMNDLISYIYFFNFNDLPGKADNGRKVFNEKKCDTCHSIDSSTSATTGPDLKKSTFSGPFQVFTAIWNHSPAIHAKMVEKEVRWPLMSNTDMRDLYELLISISN
ncbi:MAG: c-type cytochrome [Deltaproteobacteria bacterium]|nr:c-type cytochrome [Deltaproteobacteria bacterium]